MVSTYDLDFKMAARVFSSSEIWKFSRVDFPSKESVRGFFPIVSLVMVLSLWLCQNVSRKDAKSLRINWKNFQQKKINHISEICVPKHYPVCCLRSPVFFFGITPFSISRRLVQLRSEVFCNLLFSLFADSREPICFAISEAEVN